MNVMDRKKKQSVLPFFENAAALAPMAGAADSAFRSVAMEFGASFCVSEMVSAKALCLGDKNTMSLLKRTEKERPFGIQLFGADPKDFKTAAKTVAERFSPDFIDINMGCPVPKVTGSGAGCALMKTPKKAADIIKTVKDAVSVPVTAKIRSGFDEQNKNAVPLAVLLDESGVDGITVHGRTREQMYRPPVDLSVIKEVACAVSAPVIGNGDICCFSDMQNMLTLSGCRGVMIGRAALGNPFIFAEINAAVRGEVYTPPTLSDRLAVLRRQVESMVEERGEHPALRNARKHAAWYVKGFRGASSLRAKAVMLKTMKDLDDFISQVLALDLKTTF